MQARSALFDLFGDHLRTRGGAAPIAAVVRMLAALDIAAPAVRTAVSRMVRQGWLTPVRLAAGPGYTLTAKATHRLDDAVARIYRTGSQAWDGRWHVLVLAGPMGRTARARLTAGLGFLGYAVLANHTWISPRAASEVDDVLAEAGATAEQFFAEHSDGRTGATAMVRKTWDLDALATAYQCFVDELDPVLTATGTDDDEQAFAARSRLLHTWRRFLFSDPGLPTELLPESWPGFTAAEVFDRHSCRLWPAASRFVDRCLELSGERPPGDSGARDSCDLPDSSGPAPFSVR